MTVIFDHKEKLPEALTGGKNTIGIRISSHPFVRALLEKLDAPVAQTSANISDRAPAHTAAEVVAYFGENQDQPNLLIDGGAVPGVSSTVIDLTSGNPIIRRAGVMAKSDLDRLLADLLH